MDSLASLCLATEPPEREKLLSWQPQSRHENLISWTMLKHIIFTSLFQSSILFVIIFYGEFFIPEAPNYFPSHEGNVFPGRSYTFSGKKLYELLIDDYGPSRHYTIVFTTFVLMQLFNMINSWNLNNEHNSCRGIFKNGMFTCIWILILLIQIVMT